MNRRTLALLILFLTFAPVPARADLFGADVAVLTQILSQSVMQLDRLREVLGTNQANLALIQQINQGINDSLTMIRTINPNVDPGIYQDWNDSGDALRRLQDRYGSASNSPDSQVERDTDQETAQAITFSNSLYQYTGQLDELGEEIKQASHAVSPGGAEKLTAQSLGVMIQVLNQSLRAQAVTIKMASLAAANQNKRNKEETQNFLNANDALSGAMKTEPVSIQAPRF